MSCVGSFDNLCRKIVSPTRYPINQKDLSISFLIQSNASSGLRKFFTKLFRSAIVHKKNFQFSYSRETLTTFQLFSIFTETGGHKLEALQLAGNPINLVAFDFSACGKSEGEMLTYGEKEVKDVEAVVQFIKEKYWKPELRFAIWGRSMGASIALMFASLHQSQIYALVLDSPFSSLKKVMNNVAQHTSNNFLPQFLINIALYFVESKVNQISGSNIFSHDYSMHLNLINGIPIIFSYSTTDNVVRQEDVRELYQSYRGPKNLIELKVEHHQDRPQDFVDFSMDFIVRAKDQAEKFFVRRKTSLTNSTKKGISLSNRKTLKESD